MPITHLVVDNYMRVEHIDLEPTPGGNEFTGLNTHGKSSLLSAIATMGGKKLVAWKPIRDGAEEARIVIEMDGVGEVPVRMVRTIKRNGTGDLVPSVILRGPGGARFPKPQELLNAIVGEFSFDPLAVLRMDPKALQDVLKRFVPDFDFAADEAAFNTDFERRTDINRRLKEIRSQANGIHVPEGTPPNPIDVDSLTLDLQMAGDHNLQVQRDSHERDVVRQRIEGQRAESASLRQQASDYRRLAEEADQRADELHESANAAQTHLNSLAPLPAPIDPAEITTQLQHARIVNANVDALRRRNALMDQVGRLQEESDALSKALDDRRAAKADAVRRAKMPVVGLGFDDAGVVMFNGQPLDQASQAEKIRISVAIAAALSPKLKVAIVKDGSLLDRNSWALLERYADEHGLQVFIETVDSSRPTAIVIEDGRIREEAPAVAAE